LSLKLKLVAKGKTAEKILGSAKGLKDKFSDRALARMRGEK